MSTELPEKLQHLAGIVTPKPKRQCQFIYVIQCNEFVKIGVASNVASRLMELQVGNPYPMRVIGHWRAANAIQEEELIHVHLEPYRVRGEWFKLPEKLMCEITRKTPGYEIAQWLMPSKEFSAIRNGLWKLNASAYMRERQQRL